MEIGVEGFSPHKWPSVERTRQFYGRALSGEFNVRVVDGDTEGDFATRFDALLSFYGRRCWEFDVHPACPVLYAMHGSPVVSQEFLQTHLGRLETTDVLIVNCTSDIEILRRYFQDSAPQFCLLPLPVDTELFYPRDMAECREILPTEKVDFIIGFVGRLLPQRNLHHFLRLLAELKRRLAPRTVAGLVIGNYWVDYPVLNYVTEGYRDYIGELVRALGLTDDLIYLPARLSDEELAMCYGAMDVLIHPTNALDENFGYVPVEAMASGTPVVGAAYGGLKDSVVSGETGFLMPTWVTRSGIRMDMIRGLEDAERLLSDAGLRARMSEAGVRRVREHYTEAACANRLVSAVREAVGARRAGAARPVTMSPPRPAPEPAGLLPPLAQPWEHFQNAVSDYVSGLCPKPGPNSRLRLAAPLLSAGEGLRRLDDPAWPAAFDLDEFELGVAERYREARSAELLVDDELERVRLARFIEDGLLICSG
jgi:glycosyltransferase involved in cell wall biosynthesis